MNKNPETNKNQKADTAAEAVRVEQQIRTARSINEQAAALQKGSASQNVREIAERRTKQANDAIRDFIAIRKERDELLAACKAMLKNPTCADYEKIETLIAKVEGSK
jgi:hypothetical protein